MVDRQPDYVDLTLRCPTCGKRADVCFEHGDEWKKRRPVDRQPVNEPEKPEGWPDKCGRCGASWEYIGFDYADGFNCSNCGGCDSDE